MTRVRWRAGSDRRAAASTTAPSTSSTCGRHDGAGSSRGHPPKARRGQEAGEEAGLGPRRGASMTAPFNASTWLVDRQVEAGNGDRTAIRCAGESVTYTDLLSRVEAAAAGLQALGIRPEERVLMVMLDSVEFVATFLGAMRIGAI